MPVKILGLSAYYHDSAAALLCDDRIVAAAQEERFTRKKNDAAFPARAIAYCLREAGCALGDLEAVVFYDKPWLKFERLLTTYHVTAPRGRSSFVTAMPVWVKEKLFLKDLLRKELGKAGNCDPGRLKLLFSDHHLSHAASAFFPSPFSEAAILTVDGVGEWATAALGEGRGNRVTLRKELRFPHSVGLLYSAFTYYLGFEVNEGEYKLMGLAPYGDPSSDRGRRFRELILGRLVDLAEDGSLWLDQDYFDYATGLRMVRDDRWTELFGFPRRAPESPLEQTHCDLALAIQQVTEEIVFRLARHARDLTGMSRLCLAGGVALNCVANGKLLKKGWFEELWIQPAAGDAGGALGAAYAAYHHYYEAPRETIPEDKMAGACLGPSYSEAEILAVADRHRAPRRHFSGFEDLCVEVAGHLNAGKVVGWFQGRMEFGPRALGNRSILGDARNREMQANLNLRIKFRESFRPFAPSVLREDCDRYFELDRPSPYMLLIADVVPERRQPLPENYHQLPLKEKLYYQRSDIPAVTHLDYSARIQTVDRETAPRYWQLIDTFRRQTGYGVIVNTSFNVRGEPIVCSPEDAFNCFLNTDMDYLVLGDYLFSKEEWLGVGEEAERHRQEARLSCPECAGELRREGGGLFCKAGHHFPVAAGCPRLFVPGPVDAPRDVTDQVRSFYEEHPFPAYEDTDSPGRLREKARKGLFARLLDEQLPEEGLILDAGCGTGQMTNFLSLRRGRIVYGTDLSRASLQLAERFRATHRLPRAFFLEMNLFRPCFPAGTFDAVYCNGVLHHTGDPKGGFVSLARLVKPGGYFILGLYHCWGRLPTGLRRWLFRLTGERFHLLDPVLSALRPGTAKRRAWFLDQYHHPHESWHGMGEVLGWFRETGFSFVNSWPAASPEAPSGARARLFEPHPPGTFLERGLAQMGLAWQHGGEGGEFIMIGRREAAGRSGS